MQRKQGSYRDNDPLPGEGPVGPLVGALADVVGLGPGLPHSEKRAEEVGERQFSDAMSGFKGAMLKTKMNMKLQKSERKDKIL